MLDRHVYAKAFNQEGKVTGDAANIRAAYADDNGDIHDLTDTAPIEVRPGLYQFALTEDERLARPVVFDFQSSTTGVEVGWARGFNIEGGPTSVSDYVTILHEGSPVDGAEVYTTLDEAGTKVAEGTYYTKSDGRVLLTFEKGINYWVWAQKKGLNIPNPTPYRID